MSGRFLQSEIEERLREIVKRAGGRAPSFDRAEYLCPTDGTLLWRWAPVDTHARLWKSFVFNDIDGPIVFISIVCSSDGQVKEVEVWRGDSKSIASVPSIRDIKEITRPGVIDLD